MDRPDLALTDAILAQCLKENRSMNREEYQRIKRAALAQCEADGIVLPEACKRETCRNCCSHADLVYGRK